MHKKTKNIIGMFMCTCIGFIASGSLTADLNDGECSFNPNASNYCCYIRNTAGQCEKYDPDVALANDIATIAHCRDTSSNGKAYQSSGDCQASRHFVEQCANGLDDNSNGFVDESDFSCQTSLDNNEVFPVSECVDGIDNDGDGLIDRGSDSDCDDPNHNNEFSDAPQCSDGFDNDNDGLTDFDFDPECTTPDDPSEKYIDIHTECNDGYDNDNDGKIDLLDPNCETPFTALELEQGDFGLAGGTDGGSDDGRDNEGGDNGSSDNDGGDDGGEFSECSNGIDDDNDGTTDFPNDVGCSSSSDDSEGNPSQCSDSIDNDNDGAFDTNDNDCSSASDNSESGSDNSENSTECDDGIDNDGDGKIDFPEDIECGNVLDDSESTPVKKEGTTTNIVIIKEETGDDAKKDKERRKAEKRAAKKREFAGCFMENGNFTQQKELCATDQQQFQDIEQREFPTFFQEVPELKNSTSQPAPLKRELSTEENALVEQMMQKRYMDKTARNTEVKKVRLLMKKTRSNLRNLRDGGELTEEQRSYVNKSIQWITFVRKVLKDYKPTKQHIIDAVTGTKAISNKVNSMNIQPIMEAEITDIASKTESIIEKIENVLELMVQNGVELDENMIDDWNDATEEFSDMKALCMNDDSKCSSMKSILLDLENVTEEINKIYKDADNDMKTSIEQLMK